MAVPEPFETGREPVDFFVMQIVCRLQGEKN